MSDELTPYNDSSKSIYKVTNEVNGRVIYEGNDILKTIRALYCGQPTELSYFNIFNVILLRKAVAILERDN